MNSKALDLDDRTRELIGTLSLTSIDTVKLAVAKHDSDRPASGDDLQIVDVEPEFSMGFDVDEERNALRVRFGVTIDFPFGGVEVELGPVYHCDTAPVIDIEDDVLLNFTNKVALLTAFPYLRAAVEELTLRCFGNPLTLPVMEPGDVSFSPPE